MSWSLVEDLSKDDSRVSVAGRSYPVPCLVEGDDGARILVLPRGTEQIRTTLWARAHADGAELIVCVEGEGVYSVLTAEDFLEHREERAAEGVLVPVGWMCWEDGTPPTLGELLAELAIQPEPERPTSRRQLVNIHTHTEGSTLDGCSRIPALVARAAADGQPALSITDHGLVSLHPQLQRECEKAGVKPVFGMEAYFQDDRFRRATPWKEGDPRTKEEAHADTQDALWGYWHLTLLAMDNAGLRNLWAMSTEAYQDGFYADRPRLDWSTLERLGEGVIATTGCLGGPICKALEEGRPDLARERLGRLMAIFGDRLYVELGAIDLPEQVEANKHLVELAREVGLPLLVAVDSHYVDAADKENHRNWLRMQPSIGEDSYMVREHHFEPFRTAAEVEAAIAYLGEDVVDEAMANTVALAVRCTARIEKKQQLPVYSRGVEDPEAHDVDLLVELIQSNWQRKVVDRGVDEELAYARVERELNLLVPRGLPGFFLVTSDIVRWAKSQGILVGPGRGSGAASIVAYLTDITEINPLTADLPFERFLTEERVEMPDFDIDFPSSKVHLVHQYARDRFGDQYVVRIGTNQGVRVKSAVDCAARVLEQQGYAIDYAPIQRFKQVVETHKAGLFGAEAKWDDVWRLYADDLAPLRAAAPAVFDLAEWFYDLLRTYGTHPAGLAISTDEPLTYLPLRVDKNGVLVTQFDYRDLDKLGLLKYDFLLLNTLDTLQAVLDMVRERYGRDIKVYDWADDDEYADPQVWEELCAGRTLGVFQIETPAGRRLTRQLQPRSIADLSAIMALGRPGPVESGLTDTYLRRRFGDEPVSYPDPRLAEILSETYGVIVYQEQVMWTAVVLAGYSLGEADTKVRKPLGKKLPEQMALAGQEFMPRAIEMGADRQMVEDLWAMLEKFAHYSFNKSHSCCYATISYWAAWFKTHFPLEFLTARLTTISTSTSNKKQKMEQQLPQYVDEARRMGYQVLPPDVNESRLGFTPTDLSVRFGLASIKGLGETATAAIVAGQPYASFEDFMARLVEPKGSKVNRGQALILVQAGAFDTMVPNRRALERQLEAVASGDSIRCVHKRLDVAAVNGLPCGYDWLNEPQVVDGPGKNTKSVGRGERKHLVLLDPPKRCTVRCRHYEAPPALDPALVEPYTDDDLRAIEKGLFGVYLSSTPFDRIPEEMLLAATTAAEVDAAGDGTFDLIGVVSKFERRTSARSGKEFGRVDLMTLDGTLDAVIWSDEMRKYGADLRQDALVVVRVKRKPYSGGWSNQIQVVETT